MGVPVWDNPKLLNSAANALFGLALLIAAWTGIAQLVESSAFPLRKIRIEGELAHVNRSHVVAALQGRLTGTFFSMNIDTVRGLFEAIPWVRRAEVRRLWPDRLEVRLEEHVALARWGQPEDGRLVNTHGEVFDGRTDAELPLFAGPGGTEAEVARRYAAFREQLAPLQLEPRVVMLSPRYSWQLRLSNGLAMQLGRDSDKDRVADRLARFVTVYPQTLGQLVRKLDYVDLRYPNGFALRVPGMTDPAKAPERGAPPAAQTKAKPKTPDNAKGHPPTRAPQTGPLAGVSPGVFWSRVSSNNLSQPHTRRKQA
jgi:cell division protein FtsQ